MKNFQYRSERLRYHRIQELKNKKKGKNRNSKKSSLVNSFNTKNKFKYFQNYSRYFYNGLQRLLYQNNFLDANLITNKIVIPKNFTLQNNYDNSIKLFKVILSSTYLSPYNITIDFSKCKHTNISTLLFLQILIQFEFSEFKSRYQQKSAQSLNNKIIHITPSPFERTNKLLYSLNFIKKLSDNQIKKDDQFLPLELRVGVKSKIHYFENKKGQIATEVSDFVNYSMAGINYILNPTGKNKIQKLVDEILNNAEDHGSYNRWFVNGVSFKQRKNDKLMIEFNLCIINFGSSIFEGLELTKSENSRIYNKLEKVYAKQMDSDNGYLDKAHHSKESLFTLYALQNGVSRLKFKEESRGKGTMTFLRSFIDLGVLGSKTDSEMPVLNIFSGKTAIKCDKKYKPIEDKSGNYVLPLNKSENLKYLPDKKYIKSNKEYFPGTILQIKLYLDENCFDESIGNE